MKDVKLNINNNTTNKWKTNKKVSQNSSTNLVLHSVFLFCNIYFVILKFGIHFKREWLEKGSLHYILCVPRKNKKCMGFKRQQWVNYITIVLYNEIFLLKGKQDNWMLSYWSAGFCSDLLLVLTALQLLQQQTTDP